MKFVAIFVALMGDLLLILHTCIGTGRSEEYLSVFHIPFYVLLVIFIGCLIAGIIRVVGEGGAFSRARGPVRKLGILAMVLGVCVLASAIALLMLEGHARVVNEFIGTQDIVLIKGVVAHKAAIGGKTRHHHVYLEDVVGIEVEEPVHIPCSPEDYEEAQAGRVYATDLRRGSLEFLYVPNRNPGYIVFVAMFCALVLLFGFACLCVRAWRDEERKVEKKAG